MLSICLSLTLLRQSGRAEAASDRSASRIGSCEDGFSRDPNRTQHTATEMVRVRCTGAPNRTPRPQQEQRPKWQNHGERWLFSRKHAPSLGLGPRGTGPPVARSPLRPVHSGQSIQQERSLPHTRTHSTRRQVCKIQLVLRPVPSAQNEHQGSGREGMIPFEGTTFTLKNSTASVIKQH